jgi:hypothetical protein
MDSIQKVLIKMGRKDLAQEYYKKTAKGVPQLTIKDSGLGIIDIIYNEPRYKPAVRSLADVLKHWIQETKSSWEDDKEMWVEELGIENIEEATEAAINDIVVDVYKTLKLHSI